MLQPLPAPSAAVHLSEFAQERVRFQKIRNEVPLANVHVLLEQHHDIMFILRRKNRSVNLFLKAGDVRGTECFAQNVQPVPSREGVKATDKTWGRVEGCVAHSLLSWVAAAEAELSLFADAVEVCGNEALPSIAGGAPLRQ